MTTAVIFKRANQQNCDKAAKDAAKRMPNRLVNNNIQGIEF